MPHSTKIELANLQRASTGEHNAMLEQYARIKPHGLLKELHDFQERGVGFLEEKNGNALLAFEMGLGKTITALAWLHAHPESTPALIVCPSSLKLNWLSEIRSTMHPDMPVYVCEGIKPRIEAATYPICIINYDILSNWLCVFKSIPLAAVIADESHMCKDPRNNRTRALISLCEGLKHKIMLSGTPLNRPYELWSTLHILDPKRFGKYIPYAERYCASNPRDYKGASNHEELHRLLASTVMLRVKKEEVLKELPPKQYSVIPVRMSNGEYARKEKEFRLWISELKGRMNYATAMSKIEYLKQLAMLGKMDSVFEWIDNFLLTGEKLVVFGWHRACLDLLEQRYGDISVRIDGSTKNRSELVSEFQKNPNIKLFIGNIKSAGVGLTLTSSSTVLFCELAWTSRDMEQAADRVHRITQAYPVNIYYLIAKGTIEERIIKMLDEQKGGASRIIDGKFIDASEMLYELISQYTA